MGHVDPNIFRIPKYLVGELTPLLLNEILHDNAAHSSITPAIHGPDRHTDRSYAMLLPAVNFSGTLTTRSNLRSIDLPISTDKTSLAVGFLPPGTLSVDGVKVVLIIPSGGATAGNIAWACDVSSHKANELFTDTLPIGTSPLAIPSEDGAQDYLLVVTTVFTGTFDLSDASDGMFRLFVRRKATDISDTFDDSVYFAALHLLLTLDQ